MILLTLYIIFTVTIMAGMLMFTIASAFDDLDASILESAGRVGFGIIASLFWPVILVIILCLGVIMTPRIVLEISNFLRKN